MNIEKIAFEGTSDNLEEMEEHFKSLQEEVLNLGKLGKISIQPPKVSKVAMEGS